jgi:hypothetical protein
MRSELDIFSEMTLKRGGVWYRLEEKYGFSVYKTQDKYTERNYTGYTAPVYQIFRNDGKRVFASTSFTETMIKFRRLTE